MALTDKLTDIADAIRGKTGKTDSLTLDQMAVEIAGIETGGSGFTFEQIATPDGVTADTLVLDFTITRSHAFYENTGIKKIILAPGFEKSYSTAITDLFNSCAVEAIDCVDFEPMPNTDYCINPYMFKNCKNLVSAKFGEFHAGSHSFAGCTNLEIYDSCSTISPFGDNAFQNCSSLDTIVFRSETLIPLVKATSYWAFPLNGTPFDNNPAGCGGTVYVPAALVEEYKNATNWAELYAAGTCNFAAIEGSEYE